MVLVIDLMATQYIVFSSIHVCCSRPVLTRFALVTGVSKRMEWLLELMGHIRNVAYGATLVICGDTKLVCF